MRLRRLFAAAAIAGGLVLAQATAVTPAFAGVYDMACNYDYVTFNACLNFASTSDIETMYANVGLDSFMSYGYAQEIIDHGAEFRASLWGDDNGKGTFIAFLSLAPGWPIAQTGALTTHMGGNVSLGPPLDEDFEDTDEVYAQISYFDYHTGATKVFRTGTVHADFQYIIGGGTPQCFILC